MNRLIQFLLFFTVFSGILFGLHFYIFRMIVRNLELSVRLISYLKWFFWFSGLSIILGLVMSRFLNIHFLRHYGYIWLGSIAITFSFFILASIVKIFLPGSSRVIVMTALIISAGVILYSIVNNATGVSIREVNIVTTKNTGLDRPLRLVQLSDVHLDEASSITGVKRLVEKVNGLNPDIIVITGDLIDGEVHDDCEQNRELKRLKSRLGVYAVCGNHEYYTGLDIFYKFAERAGIFVLKDEKKELNPSVTLLGLKDETSVKYGRKKFVADIVKELDKNKFNILIGHRPYGIEANGPLGVDLQLAGHTHAGQIPPMDLLVQLVYRYPQGLYRWGNSHMYTSTGTGIWGPPMRFLSRNEIVLFRISRGEKTDGKIIR